MANWAFEIDIADHFIVGLTETLVDKGFRIWCFQQYEQPVYLFSSGYLAASAEADVYGQARQLVRFIDGISYLLFENKDKVNKLTLTTVFNVDTFGVMNVPRTGNAPVDFSVYKPLVAEDDDPLARLLKLVPGDMFIKNLLLILSQGMELKNVNLAYDWVCKFLADRGASMASLGYSDQLPVELRDAQHMLTDIVLSVLLKYYKLDLKPAVVKDKAAEWNDFYDSLYD